MTAENSKYMYRRYHALILFQINIYIIYYKIVCTEFYVLDLTKRPRRQQDIFTEYTYKYPQLLNAWNEFCYISQGNQ